MPSFADELTLFVVQLGDGSFTNRNTPVGAVGLSSGAWSIALGNVRSFSGCCACFCLSVLFVFGMLLMVFILTIEG